MFSPGQCDGHVGEALHCEDRVSKAFAVLAESVPQMAPQSEARVTFRCLAVVADVVAQNVATALPVRTCDEWRYRHSPAIVRSSQGGLTSRSTASSTEHFLL